MKLLLIFASNIALLHACIASTPAATTRALRARAKAATSVDDEEGLVGNLAGRSSKCPSPLMLPYSAGELRTIASLYDFKDEPESTVESGGRLTCSFDHEAEHCSWYNVQSGGVRFWRARFEEIFDLERFDCTADRAFPFEDHFLLAGGEATLLPQTVAVESRIPCQFGNATLTFDFWINSEEPVLRLCAITMDNDFNCEEMAEWDMNAPISTSIPPSVDPFKLRIEVSGLTSTTIVLIDNIRYEGQICELINDEVQITREETTDFALLANVDNEVDRPKKKRKPARPKSSIKGISMKKHRDDDTNQEEPIAAPPPPPDPEIEKLKEDLREEKEKAEKSEEAAGEEEEEQTEESKEDEGEEDNEILPTLTSAPESENVEPVRDTESVDVCEALSCTFNEEHSCLYSLGGIGSTSSWTHAHEFIGNHLTGVQQNSPGDYSTTGFVYVGQNHKDSSDEVFVMESAKFTLRKSVQLSFDLFLRSYGPQLKVCIDSFDYCPYSSPSIDRARFWYRNQAVFIPPGVRKIYFIAGKLRQNLFLAVDNIQIKTEKGNNYCDTNNRLRRSPANFTLFTH